MHAFRHIAASSSLIAGVIPEKWNHVAPSNILSQSKSASSASYRGAVPVINYIRRALARLFLKEVYAYLFAAPHDFAYINSILAERIGCAFTYAVVRKFCNIRAVNFKI